MIMGKKIHIVINPASGQPQPVLHSINKVFHAQGIEWDISLTKESGDAERFTSQAAQAGADVVAAYGGDGTVMEVARGLFGSGVPMAIFPGGTANLMSVELGIPKDLTQAAEIAASPDSPVRMVDAGLIGETYFLLRVGIGFAAEKVKEADRELKDKYGVLAYSIGALKALKTTKKAHYRITLDGKIEEIDGISCLIDNAGNIGVSGFEIAKNISVSDGLLDVIVISDSSFKGLVAASRRFAGGSREMKSFHHWQAKDIEIETDPPLIIQVDGEIVGETPLSIKVVEGAVGVLTPAN
jgi:diacylglycerol kinase (ATP)